MVVPNGVWFLGGPIEMKSGAKSHEQTRVRGLAVIVCGVTLLFDTWVPLPVGPQCCSCFQVSTT